MNKLVSVEATGDMVLGMDLDSYGEREQVVMQVLRRIEKVKERGEARGKGGALQEEAM